MTGGAVLGNFMTNAPKANWATKRLLALSSLFRIE